MCLLPARPEVVREVRRLADRIRHQGGTTRILSMTFADSAEERALIAELNATRGAEYAEVLERPCPSGRVSANQSRTAATIAAGSTSARHQSSHRNGRFATGY